MFPGSFYSLAAEKPAFGGRGYNFKIGWLGIILGHMQACPNPFLTQKMSAVMKKVTKLYCILGEVNLYNRTYAWELDLLCPAALSFRKYLIYEYVAYQNLRLIRPFPQCHLPKLKHISAEALPWYFTSLRLPWVSQWESVVALESDDPRCCIFPRSAKNNLASRSCPPPSWLCYLLVSSALCSP